MYTEKFKIAASQNIKERNYWLKKLSGELTGTLFPTDRSPTPVSPGQEFETLPFALTAGLAPRLTTLSRGSDHALHIILAAGLMLLLNKYTGKNDIIISTPVYRQSVEKELVNTCLILRNTINEAGTFKELLLRVRQTVVEATENYNYPVEILLEQLGIPFSGNGVPLLGTAVLLENIHDAKYLRVMKPNIVFHFRREEDRIRGAVEYNPLPYKETAVQRIIDHFITLVQQVIFEPGKSLSQIEIISEAEKQQVLIEFNHSHSPSAHVYPGNKTLHRLFEEQAQQTPDNIAVVGPLEINYRTYMTYISYRELNIKSNQLARLLRARGVKTDTIAGIMVGRSVEMIIGILGILKAGGAYLPIDPQTPGKRIVSLLRDSNTPVLLTHGPALNRHSYTILQDYRCGRVTPVLTRPRSQVTNLDSLPIPDRSLVDYETYHRCIGQAMVKNSIALQATRGCPFKCVYCHKIWPKHHVFRTARHIFEEVRLYYNMGVRRFVFIDDIFNLNIKNSRQFFHLILENQLDVQLFFPNGLRGDILTKAYIDLMVEAGTVNLALALETASPRLQKKIGKNLDLEKLEENIVYFCQKYPQVILELFTIHGFPSETEEEALMTLDFITRLKWTHFPYVFVLKIYPNTGMAKMAIENGVSEETIAASESLAYHELPAALPFDKSFTLTYQAAFLNDYFLSKERMLHVLPYQMNILTEDEIVQKYNSYLPAKITQIHDLLALVNITGDELGVNCFQGEGALVVPGLNRKLRNHFNKKEGESAGKSFKVLLLDLSQFFSSDKGDMLYDVVEPPLGLMYLATYLNREMGSNVTCKLAKSRIDFDSYQQLKKLLEIFNPDVIGIRTLTFYKDFFHQSVGMIRQWGIEVPIIAGGPYATSDYTRALSDRNIDVIVLGEGEVTFCELVQAIMTRGGRLPLEEELKNIPGIAFMPGRQGNNTRQKFARQILRLDMLPKASGAGGPEEPGPVNTSRPDDLAYTLFTSGSTGNPKGVMVKHHSVVNLVDGLIEGTYNYKNPVNVALLSPYVFDASVKQIFPALLSGHTLVIVPEDTRFDGEKLVQYYKEKDVQVSDGTPTHLRILLSAPSILDKDFPVERFLIGGEELEPGICQQLTKIIGSTGKRGRKREIINVYGPTEGTDVTTLYNVPITGDNKEIVTTGHISIGKPLPRVQTYILDQYQKPQPIGIAGELYIAGQGVARGYLNQPGLTNSKFQRGWHPRPIINKIKKVPGKKIYMSYMSHMSYIYRTGDRVRWQWDGNIEFLGRMDHQVKIRGYRIEPGEIENCLLKHKELKKAIVVTREGETGDKYLCAYVVPVPGSPSLTKSLTKHLSGELPGYMIPTYFVEIEKIPVTSSGKVDRDALPAPAANKGDTGTYAPPVNETERKLLQIWTEVLFGKKAQPGPIGIDENFFHLGGNSLKAAVLVSLVRKTFNIEFPLSQLFRSPSIKALSEIIVHAGKRIYEEIKPVEKKEYYELSSAQKRLYFLQQMDLENTSYNIPLVLTLGKNIEKNRLEDALRKLIARHESLRTSIEKVNEAPVQFIHDEVQFEIEYYDLATGNRRQTTENKRQMIEGKSDTQPSSSHVIRYLPSEFIRPFDLSRAPLIRSGLIEVPGGHHIWVVDIHHIVSDGTSHTVLIEDFLSLYDRKIVSPQQLRIRYKDFSEWQNRLYEEGSIKKQEDYWLNLYPDSGTIPRLNLPTDYRRPGVFTFSGDTCEFALHRNEAIKFKSLGISREGTLYMNVLAALNTLFYKYTGQTDITIGSGIAGRPHADLQHIVGMFVNTLAMRNYPHGDKTYETFLDEVIANSVRAFENQDIQFEALVDKLELERDPSRNPLFDISMVVQNFREAGKNEEKRGNTDQIRELIAADENLTGDYRKPTTKFDMTFFVYEDGDDVNINIEYYTGIFKKETIRRLTFHFKNIIKTVNRNPGITLKDIEIISQQEKQQVLYEFNDTTAEYPEDKTIHQLFAEQSEKTPDYIALVGCVSGLGNIYITYNLLNQKANQLAGYLHGAKGIRPVNEEPVGILTSHPLYLPAAILGILKSGAAYVPLDPSLPMERMKYMINDASIGTVISEKRYLWDLNRLQWECEGLHSYLCIDSNDIHGEVEIEKSELMNEELWNHVAETAIDDITGGGWISSYTGEPFSREEMDEYKENILEKLEPLLHPRIRVLEIGCASGITMFHLAPQVGFYYGTDLSRVIIEKNRKRIKEEGHQNIKLAHVSAHETRQIEERDFDLVIINSVIQCFPGHNYLRKVIRQAIDLMGEKGYLFIGDIMDQQKKNILVRELTAFKHAHGSIVNTRGDKNLTTYTTKTDFSSELFAAREFWEDLGVEIQWIENIQLTDKIYTIENELTKFRYDALISINKNPSAGNRENMKKRKYQDDARRLSAFGPGPLPLETPSHHLAYIIYTSGSTGQPKGVEVEHRGVVNTLLYRKAVYGMEPESVSLQLFSYAFDGFVTSFFTPIISGSRVILLEKEEPGDAAKVRENVVRHCVTHFIAVPPLYSALLDSVTGTDLVTLKAVTLAGDKVGLNLVEGTAAKSSTVEIVNEYGVTESSVMSTIYRHQEREKTIKVGFPIWNTRLYILNDVQQPQPAGVAGELCIAGDGLARGYLNNPELTAEKFCLRRPGGSFCKNRPLDPCKNFLLLPSPQFPIYRTGDLARWLEDGNIEFLGRIDSQLKIRAFRIEAGEIEYQLLTIEGIKEAVVIDRQDNTGQKYLCAYVVSDTHVEALELKEHLSKTLPGYMIPQYFIPLKHIPLTPNGKINRKALPGPEIKRGDGYVAPRYKIEKKLAEIWSEVLGQDTWHTPREIGIDDNFFQLGGHSLKATILASKIHRELDVKVPLAEIFKHPYIRQLADFIRQRAVEKFSRIQPVEKKEYYVLSSAQTRLMMIYKLDSHNPAYNLGGTATLLEAVDESIIIKVISALMQRHEGFRTRFKETEQGPVQIIEDTTRINFESVDLSHLSAGEWQTTLGKYQWQERLTPFCLEQAPLLRSKLLKWNHQHYELLFTMHHIIADGWSMETLTREFNLLYESHREGKACSPEPLKIQYKDYATWHHQLLSDEEKVGKAKAFWKNYLKGTPPVLNLPYDIPRPSGRTESAAFQWGIPGELTRQLQDLASANHSSLFMVLLAGFNILFSQICGQKDIVTAIPAAARQHDSLENVIGMFVNTLVLRTTVNASKRFSDFFKEFRTDTFQVLEYQDYPMELIFSELKIKYPKISVFFNMLNIETPSRDDIEDFESRHIESVQDTKFDIHYYLTRYKNGIKVSCHYFKELFMPETIEKITHLYIKVLKNICNKTGLKIEEYSFTGKKKILKRKIQPMNPQKPKAFGESKPEITKEIYEAHEKLSSCSTKFLDFVKSNPESLKRSNFSDLVTDFQIAKWQSWPMFIDGKTKKEFREASVKICDLIKSVPQLFFANHPGAIARYYEMPVQMVNTLLNGVDKEHINNLLARGDFIFSSSGLKCLEYNLSANLGGFQVDTWTALYLKNPIISRFLQQYEYRRKISNEKMLPIFFKHLIDTALEKFSGIRDVLNIVIVVQGTNDKDNKNVVQAPQMPDDRGLDLRVSLCSYRDLKIVNNVVYYQSERVHVLVEQLAGVVPPAFVSAVKAGNVIIYNGHITGLMSNKLNLAVLSENRHSDIFTADQRDTIDRYIPWTRKIAPGKTTFAGKTIHLGPFVSSHREQLVIKPAVGFGGQSVYIGKYMTEVQWRDALNTALNSRRWLVQEYVESLPYLCQMGEDGCAPHTAVWGFFIFGSTYAGAWVRVLPKDGNTGIVNRHLGAEGSVTLEMDE